ncbi:hypothetical protein DM01DRAFT_1291988 [Hesseltinella vesiculosa]|uniref:Uncharacterized protein n=1 Tax=Hesseltinella vesiculosa TaxID=101127 RepID=A0A1X2G9Q1_9FUNG|nr:hypothetical protein DM01DRAFT_1291988 [Hesseltinella vesiculosa]
MFSSLTVGDWANIDEVAKNLASQPKYAEQTAEKVKGLVVKSINTIAKKRNENFPLSNYCNQLVVFYKSKHATNRFNKAWLLEQEKQKVKYFGRLTGAKASSLGAIELGKELDNEIEATLTSTNRSGDNLCNTPVEAMHSATSPNQEAIVGDKVSNCGANGDADNDLISMYLGKQEVDGLHLQGTTVGTAIKHKALRIFKTWKANDLPVTNDQIHWMKCGLSSILDLVNVASTEEFLDCYENEHWVLIKDDLAARYRVMESPMNELFNQTWDVVASLLARTNDASIAKLYVTQVKAQNRETRKLLDLITVVISIVDGNSFLLEPANIDRVTEFDFLLQVWGPCLKAICDVHSVLRMKAGESSPRLGTMARKRLYDEVNVGFKEDLRLIYDSHHKEHDLLCLEASKSGSSAKLTSDTTKLYREAKDNLDDMVNHLLLNNSLPCPSSWFMQTNGLSAQVGSIHLSHPGLYVVTNQASIRFPSNFTAIADFKEPITLIINMIFKLEQNAQLIRQSIDRIANESSSLDTSMGRPRTVIGPCDWVYSTRPTYYDPPFDNPRNAKVPLDLFGTADAYDHAKHTSHADGSNPTTSSTISAELLRNADDFGWLKADKKYFNIYTKAYADRHPFSDVSNIHQND